VVDRLNRENVGWGVVFSVFGTALLTERIGWWDLEAIDLGLVGPLVLVMVGVAVLVSSFLLGGTQR
jgi:hypothetical protein